MAPAGVVFDLDGTLVDNIGFHAQAFDRLVDDFHGFLAAPGWTPQVSLQSS